MKKQIGIALTVALSAAVAIVGYYYSVEKETASAALGANVEIKNADFSPKKLEGLVKPISDYVQVDKKNISIASIDAGFVGIESNKDDNPFIPYTSNYGHS